MAIHSFSISSFIQSLLFSFSLSFRSSEIGALMFGLGSSSRRRRRRRRLRPGWSLDDPRRGRDVLLWRLWNDHCFSLCVNVDNVALRARSRVGPRLLRHVRPRRFLRTLAGQGHQRGRATTNAGTSLQVRSPVSIALTGSADQSGVRSTNLYYTDLLLVDRVHVSPLQSQKLYQASQCYFFVFIFV